MRLCYGKLNLQPHTTPVLTPPMVTPLISQQHMLLCSSIVGHTGHLLLYSSIVEHTGYMLFCSSIVEHPKITDKHVASELLENLEKNVTSVLVA